MIYVVYFKKFFSLLILMDNDNNFREKLNLDDLFNKSHSLDNLRIKVFNRILNRAHAKIKYTSRQRNSQHFCFFVVPEFLVGTPRYDSAACIAYITDKLLENKHRYYVNNQLSPHNFPIEIISKYGVFGWSYFLLLIWLFIKLFIEDKITLVTEVPTNVMRMIARCT